MAPPPEPAVYCVARSKANKANVLQKILDGAVKLLSSIEAEHISGKDSKELNLYFYCAPCSCLIWTVISICKTSVHSSELFFVNSWIRIDPRLQVNCCPSLSSGVGRLRTIQEEIDDLLRHREMVSDSLLIDSSWIDRVVFAAEEENASMLDRAESVASHRFLLNEYNQSRISSISRPLGSSFVTVILGDIDHLAPFMGSLDCIPNSMVPAVGQIWQVYQEEARWVRRAWQRYTLSKEAVKQKSELASSAHKLGPWSIRKQTPHKIQADWRAHWHHLRPV